MCVEPFELKCRVCGSRLTEVRLKDKFLNKHDADGNPVDNHHLARFACLRCIEASHQVRIQLMGEEAAEELYPLARK